MSHRKPLWTRPSRQNALHWPCRSSCFVAPLELLVQRSRVIPAHFRSFFYLTSAIGLPHLLAIPRRTRANDTMDLWRCSRRKMSDTQLRLHRPRSGTSKNTTILRTRLHPPFRPPTPRSSVPSPRSSSTPELISWPTYGHTSLAFLQYRVRSPGRFSCTMRVRPSADPLLTFARPAGAAIGRRTARPGPDVGPDTLYGHLMSPQPRLWRVELETMCLGSPMTSRGPHICILKLTLAAGV